MLSKYNRNDHWLGYYQDLMSEGGYTKKVFASKVGSCPCDECWKASKEYRTIHSFDTVPYHRDVFWVLFKYDWVRGLHNYNKNLFHPTKTQREWGLGFELGLEGGNYFEQF